MNLHTHHISVNQKNLSYFQALSSETRIKIIELLQQENLSINEISQRLEISSAMVTKHISILEENHIVESTLKKGIRGRLKICELKKENITLIFNPNKEQFRENVIKKELPIGSFYDFQVTAPCGLTTTEKLVGFADDPGVFYYQEKSEIQLLWFTEGILHYHIPIFDVTIREVKQLEITLEICSEHPGYKMHFPSDIFFEINHLPLGKYTSPGDFGNRKGVLTPTWWDLGTQFGRLVSLRVDDTGTYIDEKKVSGTTIQQIIQEEQGRNVLDFSIATGQGEFNGGLNLFGKEFGDFTQDIEIVFSYE